MKNSLRYCCHWVRLFLVKIDYKVLIKTTTILIVVVCATVSAIWMMFNLLNQITSPTMVQVMTFVFGMVFGYIIAAARSDR